MIDKLKLTNFKCFKEETIHFKPMTILTGANAAGKSSVIQAFLLMQHSNEWMKNKGEKWQEKSIDINQVFGFPVGAPNALVSQNPTEDGDFDFAFEMWEAGEGYRFQYIIDKTSPLDLKINKGMTFSDRSFQYLNAERVGPRMVNQAGQKNGIVYNGENATYLMDMADKTNRGIADVMAGEAMDNQKFSFHVERWMSAILGEMQLDFHTDYNKAITELWIKNSLVDIGVVPTLTGFGISYVLPIVVAGLWASGETQSLLMVENPEAHLHPYAQSNMGKFLALLAYCGVQVVVETHSEHIIDGARCQMTKLGSSSQMLVDFMQQSESGIKTYAISVSSGGELDKWPKGFFDQKQQDLREIMMLRRKNAHDR